MNDEEYIRVKTPDGPWQWQLAQNVGLDGVTHRVLYYIDGVRVKDEDYDHKAGRLPANASQKTVEQLNTLETKAMLIKKSLRSASE